MLNRIFVLKTTPIYLPNKLVPMVYVAEDRAKREGGLPREKTKEDGSTEVSWAVSNSRLETLPVKDLPLRPSRNLRASPQPVGDDDCCLKV